MGNAAAFAKKEQPTLITGMMVASAQIWKSLLHFGSDGVGWFFHLKVKPLALKRKPVFS